MSNQGPGVERWQAPFFDQPKTGRAQPAAAELLVLAQASGFQEGRQEGLESGKKEAAEIVQNMLALAEEMSHPFRNMDQLVARELTKMAVLLAEKIVGRELTINSDIVVEAVQESLSTLSSLDSELEVHLNPVDVERIKSLAPELLEGISWRLVETTDLLPGGCRVKTPVSLVDGSVEKHMEKVFASLLDASESQS